MCQLQGYSQVSVDGICNGARAPATRLRRPARVHEITITAGSDSSSTFGVGTVGSQPLTHEGCSSATQSPSVCVDRQRQNAWQLANSIASLATVLQSVVASQPAADDGAVCDEVTASA